MNVIVREAAEDDLDRIFTCVAQDSPRAAGAMVSRIRDRINHLEVDSLTNMGRPGLVEGTRELIEYPYVIV
jgi:plasmid stabilization system protein ParE